MNSVQLVGRFVKDPEIKYTDGGTTIARFNLAVDRRFKKEGEQSADFISCKAFGKTAEFIEKYFHKGERIGLQGHIQTGSYEKDGTKYYTTEVIADATEFVDSKGGGQQNQAPSQPPAGANDGFMNIPDGIDEELPFN